MSLSRYKELMIESGTSNVFGIVEYNINETNERYYLESPNANFILFKRKNEVVKTGFNTIMLLKGYDIDYFNKIPSRADNILEIEEGNFDDLKLLRGHWVKEALA